MYDVDGVSLIARELLRERSAELIAAACAWSVGLTDQPHFRRRHGRVVPSGGTLGEQALADLPLGSEEDGRLDLADSLPGSFRDALNALASDGTLHADIFEEEVLAPFVIETCVRAARHFARDKPADWAELLDDLGEDGSDLIEVVRASEWEAPLRMDAEEIVLSALGDAPILQVEAEGLPLSIVHAAEAMTREAAPRPRVASAEDELAGALFLAQAALRDGGFSVPVTPAEGDELLDALLGSGLEPDEVVRVLPHLPVLEETAAVVAGAAARLASS